MIEKTFDQETAAYKGSQTGQFYLRLLLLYIPVFFSVLFVISALRYLNFYTADADLGINMQELWTTTHGMLMFDSSDFEIYGTMSHLEVHTSYIALLFAYPYRIFPGPYFLFALQDAAISLSVIVLFFLSSKMTENFRISFMIAVGYSLNATLLGAVFYDFHWLSFIPLESFVLFYALLSRWKFVSILTIIAGSLTQEVFPFIALGFLLFYFADSRRGGFPSRDWFFSRDGRFYIYTAIFTAFLYISLALIQQHVVPSILNNFSVSHEIGANSSSRFLISTFNPVASLKSIAYWLLSLMLLLFLPVFRWKNFLIFGAWMYETILVDPSMGTLGNQYSFVTLSLLVPAAIVTLSSVRNLDTYKIRRYVNILILLSGGILIALLADGIGMNPIDMLRLDTLLTAETIYVLIIVIIRNVKSLRTVVGRFGVRKLMTLLFIVILSSSLILSPFNSVNDNRYNLPGYEISYGVNPESAYIPLIQSLVPAGSTIVASDNIFPVVADHDRAFEFYNTNMTKSNAAYFPFNGSNLPKYILYDSYQSQYLPSWVLSSLGYYGLVLQINGTGYPGNIYLYEISFSGQPIYR